MFLYIEYAQKFVVGSTYTQYVTRKLTLAHND